MKKSTWKKIIKWWRIKNDLISVKDKESNLRDAIVAELCPDELLSAGTHYFDYKDIDAIKTVSIQQSMSTSVDIKVLKKIPEKISKKLFRVSLSLNQREYKNLDKSVKRIVDRYITRTPIKPQLKLIDDYE